MSDPIRIPSEEGVRQLKMVLEAIRAANTDSEEIELLCIDGLDLVTGWAGNPAMYASPWASFNIEQLEDIRHGLSHWGGDPQAVEEYVEQIDAVLKQRTT